MKRCKCEHWQTCPTCYPQGFDEHGARKPVEIPSSREELQREITALREQVEKWKSLHESLTKLNEAQESRHEKQVEKLTEESVVLRASSRSKLETISSLELQVEKLTKERDALKTVPMKYRRMQFNAELQEEVTQLQEQLAAKDADNKWLRSAVTLQAEQLAALTEQNAKMREALITISIAWSSNEIYSQHFFNEALSLPNLAAIDAAMQEDKQLEKK